MKDMGLIHYFFSLEIWQGHGEIFVGQGKYTIEILRSLEIAYAGLQAHHHASSHKLEEGGC